MAHIKQSVENVIENLVKHPDKVSQNESKKKEVVDRMTVHLPKNLKPRKVWGEEFKMYSDYHYGEIAKARMEEFQKETDLDRLIKEIEQNTPKRNKGKTAPLLSDILLAVTRIFLSPKTWRDATPRN